MASEDIEADRMHQLQVLRKINNIDKILNTTPMPYSMPLANATKDLLIDSIHLIRNTLRILHLDHVSDGFKLNALSRAISDSLLKIEPILDSQMKPGWIQSPKSRVMMPADDMSVDESFSMDRNNSDHPMDLDFEYPLPIENIRTFYHIGEDSTLNILQMLDFQSLATVASVNKALRNKVEQIQWSSVAVTFQQENSISIKLNSGRVRSKTNQWPFESHYDVVKEPKPIIFKSLVEVDDVFQQKGHHILDICISDCSTAFVGLVRKLKNLTAIRFENALSTKALQALAAQQFQSLWMQIKCFGVKFDGRLISIEEASHFDKLFSSLKSLRKLTVNYMNYGGRSGMQSGQCVANLLQKCPNLENLASLDFYGNGTDTACINPILSQCIRLKRLCIQADKVNKNTSNIIQEVCHDLTLLAIAAEDITSPVSFSTEDSMDMSDLVNLVSTCSKLEVLAVYMTSMELSDEFLRMGGDLPKLRELYFKCDWSSENKSMLASFLRSLLRNSPLLTAVHIPVGGEFGESLLSIICKNRNQLEVVELGKLPMFGEDALWRIVKNCPELVQIGGLTEPSKQLFSAFKSALYLERSFAF